MLIKGLDVALIDYKDEPVKDPDIPNEPLTPRKVMCRALMATPLDASLNAKVKASNLARDIYKAESDITLLAEDLVQIRKQIAQAYGPIVVGPMNDITK